MFLSKFFTADDTAENLAVWEYTAGWFQQELASVEANCTAAIPILYNLA